MNASHVTTSEGFDLDAIPDGEGDDEVIYEIGGGTTCIKKTKKDEPPPPPSNKSKIVHVNPLIEKSEGYKAQGNEDFLAGRYLDAYDHYTSAIEACPGIRGEEILTMKEKHEEAEREKAYSRHTQETLRRRKISKPMNDKDDMYDEEERNRHFQKGEKSTSQEEENEHEETEEEKAKFAPVEFRPPHHSFAEQLAVYHANRAACLLHILKYDDAIKDCTIALLLNPRYVKALVRRMTAYESADRTEEALRDAKTALECDPNNSDVKRHVKRLQKLEDERLEKLKEETLGKLKEVGNSVLGYFGLSLDNFKAEKDPNTGSYSISFQQNK